MDRLKTAAQAIRIRASDPWAVFWHRLRVGGAVFAALMLVGMVWH